MIDFDFEIISISEDGNVLVRYTPQDVSLQTRDIHVFAPDDYLIDPDPQVLRSFLARNSPQWRWEVEEVVDFDPVLRQQHLGVLGSYLDIPPVLPELANIVDIDLIVDRHSMVYVDGASANLPKPEDSVVVVKHSGNDTDLVQMIHSLESNSIYTRRLVAGVWQPSFGVVLDEDLYGWRDLIHNITAAKVIGPNNVPEFKNLNNTTGLSAYSFNVNDEVFVSLNVPHDYVAGSLAFLHLHFTTETAPSVGQEVEWGFEFSATPPGGDMLSSLTTLYRTFVFDGTESDLQHSILFGTTGIPLGLPDGIISLRLFLNSSTLPFTNDVFGLACGVHYQYSTVVDPDLVISYV